VSSGTIVLGLLNGLIFGLLAVGLVLVYNSNRFLNLAQGQLGALSALLLAKWVLDWGWSWWVAFILAIAVGSLVGLLVERFLVRPLRQRTDSPVRLLLLSLAVSQIVLGLTYVPSLGPDQAKAPVYPQPFAKTVSVGGVVLDGTFILTAILVPVLVAALAAFMRFSVFGKQIRAAANNPDAARLCGISVGRVSAITWGVAGGFSALAAILYAPTQAAFNGATLGPFLLMATLGAAAFGAFVSLSGALIGGLLLGLTAQIVSSETSGGNASELAVFGLIMLIVLVRGRAIGRVFAVTGAAAEDLPVTKIPESLRSAPLVRYSRAWLTLGALAVAVIWPLLPYFNTSGHTFFLSNIIIYALLGVGLTMLVGWGGQVSLGQFAIVGLGAYLAARWSTHGWSLPALCIAIGVIGAVVMTIIGLPALRVRGLTLAVTTLGLAVVADDWLFNQSWLGSSFGVTLTPLRIGAHLGTPHTQRAIYYVCVAVLTLAVFTAGALRRSAAGRVILAVRDNERASSAFGVFPSTVKLTILAISGFYAGVAGVLWAEAWSYVTPAQFPASLSIALITLPVIGGLGSVGGAVAAAVLLYGATFFLSPHLNAVFGNFSNGLAFSLILAGLGMAFALIKMPTGIAGATQTVWQRFLERRASRPDKPRLLPDLAKTDDMPLVVRDVEVKFGGVVALNHVNIEVRSGEIVGLIGTNGAGKTTLMNVISGLIKPQSGSVRLFGNEVNDLSPDFRAAFGTARSFQDASLFAGLTVTETIQIAMARTNKVGALSAMVGAPWVRANERATRRAAEEIVDRFGLRPWADTRTCDLSTGTRRICDLAAQVAATPKLILLDEPTAGVAQREAEAFGPLLKEIREGLDCAVLIVEHDMPLLMGVCDRVYALESGSVIAEGTPEQVRSDPRVVASYLGTNEAAIVRSGKTVPRQASRKSTAAPRSRARKQPSARRTS